MSNPNNPRAVPAVMATHSIQDGDTRRVVDPIIEGWRIRNGLAGDPMERFVTLRELNAIQGGGQKIVQEFQSAPGAAVLPRLMVSREVLSLTTNDVWVIYAENCAPNADLELSVNGGAFSKIGVTDYTGSALYSGFARDMGWTPGTYGMAFRIAGSVFQKTMTVVSTGAQSSQYFIINRHDVDLEKNTVLAALMGGMKPNTAIFMTLNGVMTNVGTTDINGMAIMATTAREIASTPGYVTLSFSVDAWNSGPVVVSVTGMGATPQIAVSGYYGDAGTMFYATITGCAPYEVIGSYWNGTYKGDMACDGFGNASISWQFGSPGRYRVEMFAGHISRFTREFVIT